MTNTRYSESDWQVLKDETERLERANRSTRKRLNQNYVDGKLLTDDEKKQLGVGESDTFFLSPATRSMAWPR